MGGHLAHVLRRYFRRPPVVLQLSLLATFLSAGIIVLMAVGSAEVLLGEGSGALPLVYLLLAGVLVLLASGISAALGRWPVARISGGVSLAAVAVTRAVALAPIFRACRPPSASLPMPSASFSTRCSGCPPPPTCLPSVSSGTRPSRRCLRRGRYSCGHDRHRLLRRLRQPGPAAAGRGLFHALLQYRRIAVAATSDEGIGEDGDPGIGSRSAQILNVIRIFSTTGAIAAGVLLMSVLFCSQDYLAMTAYQDPSDAGELASFMAIVYAGHQAAELLILAGFGRLILERAGPVIATCFSPSPRWPALSASPASARLPPFSFTQNVIALSNAVFEPVKTLNFAALSFRVLGQVRMLVDGVLYPLLGVALSALGLLWLQSWAPRRPSSRSQSASPSSLSVSQLWSARGFCRTWPGQPAAAGDQSLRIRPRGQ
ncbi:MAG: hypothetical protein U1E33_05830 [Rhodospirillales bacterium]